MPLYILNNSSMGMSIPTALLMFLHDIVQISLNDPFSVEIMLNKLNALGLGLSPDSSNPSVPYLAVCLVMRIQYNKSIEYDNDNL